MTFGTLLALIGTAWAAECERPTTGVDIERAIAKAREAYVARDPVGLAAAVVEGRVAARCIVEPMPADLAEALHLAHGLWVSLEQGEDAAAPYLAAGRIPEGSRAVGLDLTTAEVALVQRLEPTLEAWTLERGAPVAPALSGRLLLDGGAPPRRQPANAPFVLQRVRGESILSTDYVHPGDALPRYRRLRPVLATLGITLAAGTAGLTAGAALTRAELYGDQPSPLTDAEVQALASRNHGLLIAAAATGGLAAASAGAFVLSYRF